MFFTKRLLSLCMATVAISACEKDEPSGAPSLYVGEVTAYTLLPDGETKTIELLSNAQIGLDTEGTADWCHVTLSGNTLTVKADPYTGFVPRSTKVSVYIQGGQYEELTFSQLGKEVAITYQVDSATASSTHEGEGIEFTFDGVRVADQGLIYHSNYGQDTITPYNTVTLTYYLHPSQVMNLAMIAYYHRQSLLQEKGNGTFGYIDVYTSTSDVNSGSMTWDQQKQHYRCGNYGIIKTYPFPVYIELDAPVANVTAVRIVVDCTTSKAGFASCAEMEFYGTASPDAASTSYLELSKYRHEFDTNGGSEIISVLSSDANPIVSGVPDWCTYSITGGYISIAVPKNTGAYREATFTVSGSGITREVKINQARELTDEGRQLEVDLSKSSADSWFSETGAEGPFDAMFDDDYTTHWHSNYGDDHSTGYGPKTAPHSLYFYLKGKPTLSYIIYYPRNYPSGGNGNWWNIDVYVSYGGDNFDRVLEDYNCGGKGELSKIVLPADYRNVDCVKIVVKKQQNSSCSEIRFFGT
ncbi:MAG: hypothetical protein LBK18_02910 [Prevotellaceae bacterium]|nr:hypothetical protein [Prevotellaceae bacterium]